MKKTILFTIAIVSSFAFAEVTKQTVLPGSVKNPQKNVQQVKPNVGVQIISTNTQQAENIHSAKIEVLEKLLKEKDAEILKLKQSSRVDRVNEKQVDVLKERIDLVKKILIKHKKAYDYRVTTTNELKDILGPEEVKTPEVKVEPKQETKNEAPSTAVSEIKPSAKINTDNIDSDEAPIGK